MPFKNKAQARAMHAKASRGEISKKKIKEFDKTTNWKKLPEALSLSKAYNSVQQAISDSKMAEGGFSPEETQKIVDRMDLDLGQEGITIEELCAGINSELEHGSAGGEETDVTHDDPIVTAKVALAHLREDPRYYAKLAKMEVTR